MGRAETLTPPPPPQQARPIEASPIVRAQPPPTADLQPPPPPAALPPPPPAASPPPPAASPPPPPLTASPSPLPPPPPTASTPLQRPARPPPPRAAAAPPALSTSKAGRSSVGRETVPWAAAVSAVLLLALAAAFLCLFTRWRRRQHSSSPNQAQVRCSSISFCNSICICASESPSAPNGGKAQPTPQVSVGVRTFTLRELSNATDQFSQINFLGQGGFGSVYKGIVITADGDVNVAIKQLQSESVQGENEFVTEINVISRVHHRNLVSLVGYCVSGAERLLVYEYVDNNNLAFHLRARVAPTLDWPTRLSIALGAAKGIAYLHEECHPRIIHRDIKSANILLDSNFMPKVADFGLAKFFPDDKTHVTTRIIGTVGYLAPEYGSSGQLTEKSDVFSFGTVLLELISGRSPINLVEWASPLLDQALEDGNFDAQLIDPFLETSYDHEQMRAMVTCAAISVHRFPDHRPKMSQVVQVLEGNASPEKLKAQTSRPQTRRWPTLV